MSTATKAEQITAAMRNLWSELNSLLESGDITEQEANDWANMKAEQWKDGI